MKSVKQPAKLKKLSTIRQVAKKRSGENRQYSVKKALFLIANPECQISAPGCSFFATVIHHTKGRENKLLLLMRYWKASCEKCNIYIEEHSAWAYDNGHKLYKHQKNQEWENTQDHHCGQDAASV